MTTPSPSSQLHTVPVLRNPSLLFLRLACFQCLLRSLCDFSKKTITKALCVPRGTGERERGVTGYWQVRGIEEGLLSPKRT